MRAQCFVAWKIKVNGSSGQLAPANLEFVVRIQILSPDKAKKDGKANEK